MIRKKGSRYEHVDNRTGAVLGRFKHRADAQVHSNALKLIQDNERRRRPGVK